jgi:mannose-6-phosphate isomerase-like protein (cupin superfamily)
MSRLPCRSGRVTRGTRNSKKTGTASPETEVTNMTEIKQITEAFPGAIGVTHLKVYDSPGPNGVAGGSPHMHFACSEAYLVIKGRGSVQTLSSAGFREIPLRAGSLVWFTPGLIHRLINEDARLEIFAVMENAGLPEHGDSVFTFPSKHLRDEDSYWQVASLESGGSFLADPREAARKRRDLAVEGFHILRVELEKGGSLQVFYGQAVRLMRSKEPTWRGIWEAGAVQTVQRTGTFLDQLNVGASDYLDEGAVFEVPVDPDREERRLGMCGTLRPYFPEGVLRVMPNERQNANAKTQDQR